jgi:sterol desaturase/sphingolipid hydroxylase (fatty acid hydroxylase superfamily)
MDKPFVSNADQSVRMFENSFLEWFTHIHPAIPHLIYLPVIAGFIFFGFWQDVGWSVMTALFLAGLLMWTFTEYVVHRFVFHTTPEVMEATQRIVRQARPGEAIVPKLKSWHERYYFIAHGVHHDFPSDSRRLVLAPSVSIPGAVFFYFVFRMTLGATLSAPFFAGFAVGYLAYDTIHFTAHHRRLPGRIGKWLKKRHLQHHFADSHKNYGVSSPLWDVVFGTFGRGGNSGPQSS